MGEVKFRLLKAEEIDVRVNAIHPGDSPTISLLLYKDARCDMAILDETVGPFNWRKSYTRNNVNCILEIYDSEKKEWIAKEDAGSTKSNFEKDKTLASDSFKRAAVCWGIGRELYTAPSIHWKISWTAKTRLEDNYCGDKFVVTEIDYFDNREIKSVTILDKDSDVEVKYNADGKMKFIKAPQKPEPKPEPEEEVETPKVIRTKEKAEEEPKADTPANPAEEPRLPADTAEVVDDLPFARK